jgi:diguanylate cyclase (GGDEF)-like protein/PAS domain S-box-containing protein
MTTQHRAIALERADTAWRRLHRALMPDYNPKAAAYWWAMVATGAVVVWIAFDRVRSLPTAALLQVVASMVIAMVVGCFPVRVPRSKNSFAAGEVFIFLLLMLHGPAAAALAAAGEGFVGSYRTSKRWTSRIASPAIASVAMFTVGTAMHAGLGLAEAHGRRGALLLLVAAMLCSVSYFVLNTLLIAAIPYLKRNQWPLLRDLFGDFGWIGVTYAGSASVAVLLYVSFQASGLGVLAAAIPIIAMLICTLHYVFRQHEAAEQVRQGRLEAAEREAGLASRHTRELAFSERRFHSAFMRASIGMALVSFDSRVQKVNPALLALLGQIPEEAIDQRRFSDFVEADDALVLNDRLMQLNSQHTQAFSLELRLRHAEGLDVWAVVHGSFFTDEDSSSPSLILQVQDITARRRAEAELQHIAFHDSLTGLPNRRRFHEKLDQAIETLRTEPARRFGVMFLDFDRFKLINDSLGHAVGDEFLRAAAARITQQARPVDLVARLGGDEFAILVEDADIERTLVLLADRLLLALGQPLDVAGTELTTSASIGITFSKEGYGSKEEMLRDADIAMYKAKTGGKARYELFDTALHTDVSYRLRLEGDLRRALANHELAVAYQPTVDLTSGQITGFEALARWDHPELGAIPPTTFIPIAEDTGLIVQLTDQMLLRACRQLKTWHDRDGSCAELRMHVNLSSNDIAHPKLVGRVSAALRQAGLEPRHLTLELTENILMQRLEDALPRLTELRRLGVGLSVDDFGTGYSSLQHLSSLPVTSLKIDRAFVAGLEAGNTDAAVVRAIVLLGNSLGKSIIAEGIETAEQMEQLRSMGCATGQGHHMFCAVSAECVDDLLESHALLYSRGIGARDWAVTLH